MASEHQTTHLATSASEPPSRWSIFMAVLVLGGGGNSDGLLGRVPSLASAALARLTLARTDQPGSMHELKQNREACQVMYSYPHPHRRRP